MYSVLHDVRRAYILHLPAHEAHPPSLPRGREQHHEDAVGKQAANAHGSHVRIGSAMDVELPESTHDWTATVTTCGRICYKRRKTNLSQGSADVQA